MNKLFDANNPLMRALAVAADLMMLNLITAVLCIPVLTAAPAITALYDIVIRIVQERDSSLIVPYFRAFASNFKKSFLLGLLLLFAAVVLYVDYLAALAYIPQLNIACIAMALIILAISFYAFALLARYENTLGNTLLNAAKLAVANFPRTLYMLVFALGLWVVCIHFYRVGTPVLILFGLSLPCYMNALLLADVFRKLEGQPAKEELKQDSSDESDEENGETFNEQ